MLKMTTKKYIQIPNVAFAFGTDYKLNKDDIKVYAYLRVIEPFRTMIRTNVEFIVEDLDWKTTKVSRDKTRVANALQNLMDKGYIKIIFKKDIKKENLKIEINDSMKDVEAQSTVDWKQKPFRFSGYTNIQADEYNIAGENNYHLLIIGYYLWRENLKKKYNFEYAICDKEWAEVLELGVTRTRTIINDYTPFLNKISGAKYKDNHGQWKQEPNQYKMDKHMSVESKINKVESEVKSMSYREQHAEKVTDKKILMNQKIFDAIFDFKKGRLDAESYKAWKETKCEHTKKTGQLKIDKLMKLEGGRNLVDRLEREYQQDIKDAEARERSLEHQRLMAEKHMEEMEFWDDEFVSNYKRKESRNDISAFLN
ncbi:hypothetical protein [Bacillus sp. FSL M8-0168]|uniref:hypothetical protein n=1 Tax=Bacillus sp. FSL M8-0168 TaxID=2921614 RepID=UPI0030FD2AC7